jgi:hypothetical protein
MAVHLAFRQSTLRQKKNQWPIHQPFYVNGTAKKQRSNDHFGQSVAEILVLWAWQKSRRNQQENNFL